MSRVRRRARPAVRHQVSGRKRALDQVIQMLDHVVPPGRNVTLVSYPDLDDNIVGLLRSPARPRHVVALVNDPVRARRRAEALDVDVPMVARLSPRGLWVYLRSQACVTTHGVFGKRRRGRGKVSVTTWHGELGKTSGMAAGEPPEYFDRMYASSSTSAAWRVAEAGVHYEAVAITGMPRQQYLQRPHRTLDAAVRRVVWAPTYRIARTGLSRVEGSEDRLGRMVTETVRALEPVLAEHDAELWLRFHPAARGSLRPTDRVLLGDDESLERHGMTLFDLLGSSDCLVTDFSAIWTDYVLRDRPLICALPDGEEYLSQRAMTLEPHEAWFPGPIAPTSADVVTCIRAVLGGADPKQEQRRFLASVFHPLAGTGAAEAIWGDLEVLAGR